MAATCQVPVDSAVARCSIPSGATAGSSGRSDPSDGLEAVHDVQVKVQAVLGRTRMPIGQLLQLTNGAVLELDRRVPLTEIGRAER